MGQLLLVRHAQASFGTDDYDVLSETGWAQARLLGRWLAECGLDPDVVVHGGMRRHRETAEAMVAAAGWASYRMTTEAGWAEFDHLGVVAAYPEAPEGELDRRGFQRVFERATAHWAEGGEGYPEPYVDFLARVQTSLDRACALAGPGGTAVVVSSGGPIAAACAELVDPGGDPGGDPNGDLATRARLWSRFNTVVVNSSVSRVLVGATGPRLLTFNEHSHVAGEMLTYR